MKISFQFDHSARRLVLEPESDLEKGFMREYYDTAKKGTGIMITQPKEDSNEYKIELRINGFEKERVGG